MPGHIAFRALTIDWRVKVAMFWLFDRLPGGRLLYYLTQKYVTKTVPRQLSPTIATSEAFLETWYSLQRHFAGQAIAGKTLFEFGAGWDLFGNLVYWCYGVDHQIVVDVTRWARPDQVNIVIRHLQADPPPGAKRVPKIQIVSDDRQWEADLLAKYGIDYRAPADAARSGLPDGSVDAITSTSVLEHLPPAMIPPILRECRRILRPDGVMCHFVDHSDHYAHSDPSIGPYNFLVFTARQWRRYNPRIHYQNRLREDDYIPLFEQAGFTVIETDPCIPDGHLTFLRAVTLAPDYAARPDVELLPICGRFVMRPGRIA